MKKQKIDQVYEKIKALKDKSEMKSEIFRGEVLLNLLDILGLVFNLNGDLEACKRGLREQGINIWQKSDKNSDKNSLIAPPGYMSVEAFQKHYGYPHPSTLTRIIQCDSAVKDFGKKISKNVFVEGEKIHQFFLTDEGKDRYPRIYSRACKYEEKKSYEHKRQGEANSQSPAFL